MVADAAHGVEQNLAKRIFETLATTSVGLGRWVTEGLFLPGLPVRRSSPDLIGEHYNRLVPSCTSEVQQ
jgi:hypothetical protein